MELLPKCSNAKKVFPKDTFQLRPFNEAEVLEIQCVKRHTQAGSN
jgi:hypothetical protein